MKNLKYLVLSLMIFIGVMSFDCTNDEDPNLFNNTEVLSVIGVWDIEKYPGEYIEFTKGKEFSMNDSIFGTYNIQDKNDHDIWIYWAIYDQDGEIIDETEGNISILNYKLNYKYQEFIIVKGLPTHEEETLKIIHRKH